MNANIRQLLEQGEGISVEFKKATNQLMYRNLKEGELKGELNGELNTGQTSVYQLIKKQEGINASLLSKELKIPFSTVDKHIRVLIKKHFIERQGSKKTGGYYIVKTLTII